LEQGSYFQRNEALLVNIVQPSRLDRSTRDEKDSMVPLVNDDHDSEAGTQRYLKGYTLFEVFCIILIALSALSILILLLAWGPITTLQLKYWKELAANTGQNNNGGRSERQIQQDANSIPNIFILGEQPQPKSDDKENTNSFYNGDSDVVIISGRDFSKITETTLGLKIQSLLIVDGDDGPIFTQKNYDQIQRLELLGPVSKAGLEILFTQFKFIQYLYVDVDRVCTPSYHSRRRVTPVKKTMPQLLSIFVQNSEQCKIFDWPIVLETPRLQSLKVVDAILKLENFNKLQQFVAGAQETLEELEISRSFICEECDLSEVQYDNLAKITVNKRRTKEALE